MSSVSDAVSQTRNFPPTPAPSALCCPTGRPFRKAAASSSCASGLSRESRRRRSARPITSGKRANIASRTILPVFPAPCCTSAICATGPISRAISVFQIAPRPRWTSETSNRARKTSDRKIAAPPAHWKKRSCKWRRPRFNRTPENGSDKLLLPLSGNTKGRDIEQQGK